MKKVMMGFIAVCLAAGLTFPVAEAAKKDDETKRYKNCTELNKVYKGGVARTAKATNKGSKTKYKPHVSQALYDANKKLDRDKDMIACEK
ncbi:excalibur calcium-binding domain-containing protein [Paenibacillus sp. NPDC058071]|uniref:excalibur calcium-binding domain-containing protein n=1 Tax=Paenibacillus sp. NPDC058071 TaxID=3346326 RepID=UPI0036DE08CA